MQCKVYGPSYDRGRDRYKVEVRIKEGSRTHFTSRDRGEAEEYASTVRRKLLGQQTIGEALEDYRAHLAKKGNLDQSIATTMMRLSHILPSDAMLSNFGITAARSAYERRTKATRRGPDGKRVRITPDTHRNELLEARTFFGRLLAAGIVPSNPFAHITPIGRRARGGKRRLSFVESIAFDQAAAALFLRHRDDGALAALLAMRMGLRSGEIRNLAVHDVDAIGKTSVLIVREGKTHAAARRLEIPEDVAPLIVKQASKKTGALFPGDSQDGLRVKTWLLKATRRVARAALIDDADKLTAHGLRGTNATLAEMAGAVPALVAQALGHTSHKVTERHYLEPGTIENVKTRRATLAVVQGGKR